MGDSNREKITAQGNGYPVPATLRGEQAGSRSSISNDRNTSEVMHSEDPFGRSSRMPRSPTRPYSMQKTERFITPSDTPVSLDNPSSSMAGAMDSDEGKILHHRSDTSGNFTLRAAGSSEKSIDLEKENMDLLGRLQKMEQLFAKLSEEIEYLKRENKLLKMNPDAKEHSEFESIEPEKFNYSTNEDELERETNWILKKKKSSRKSKKRKAESSPEADQLNGSGTISTEPKVVQPEVNQSKDSKSTNNIAPKLVQPKEKPPPPINIVGVTSYSIIQSLMNSVTDKEYKVTALNNNVWKINTLDSDSYRTLSMKLNAEKYQWFTYEDKQARPIKVMARGLHHTCSSIEIMEDLQNKGFKILDAVNIVKKERTENQEGNQTFSKRGLPLFMLVFDKQENVQNIYGIKGILHMKVKIEPMRRTTTRIPQCKKCQGFNHTQRYCSRDPRCVKCSGKHITQTCTIGKDVPAKCINCTGQHPANYRGCEVAKQLQKLRDKTRNQQQNHEIRRIQTSNQMDQNPQPRSAGQRRTFAQVVKDSGSTKHMGSENNRIMENIMNSIKAITKRLDDQNNLNNMIFDQLKKMQVPQRNPIKNVK